MTSRVIIAAAILVAQVAFASPDWQVRSWTTDDALPQGTVHAIRQTRDGYLWFTTYGGLVRYDGMTFRIFERATTPGIVSNRFTTLYEDSGGTLWAGTEDGYLTANRSGTFTTYHAGGAANAICTITEAAGTLWIMSNDGFFAFDRNRFVARTPPSFGSATLTTPSGYGYQQGFAYPTNTGTEIIRPDLRRRLNEAGRVYTDQRGTIWIAQPGRVLRTNGPQIEIIDVPVAAQASAVLRAADGALWLAVDGKGIARVSGNAIEWVTEGLPSRAITTLFEDREGTVWVATADNGIACIRPRIARVWGFERGLAAPNVYPIIATERGLLVGSWGAGVFRLDGGRFRRVAGSKGPVMSVLEEADGTVWWTVYGQGVFRAKGNAVRVFGVEDGVPNLIVPVLYRDRKGRIWIGSHGGLAVLEDERFRPLPVSLPPQWREIHVLAEDREGRLVVGTRAGVGRVVDGKFEIVADERAGLSSGNVRALHLDKDGTLWVGTYDDGLNRVRNGRIVSITTRQGLYDNGVFAILESDAFFWMSSNRGIYRVSRAELNAVADGWLRSLSCLTITRRDGLASAECNGGVQSAGCKTPDGRLWFPTQQGVVMIDPRLLHAGGPPPEVRLVRAAVDGEEIPAGPVRVRAGSKRIDIDFASMTFIDAERVRYRYMLAGLDEKWSQMIGARTVSYAGLPPGQYRFVVSSANAAGLWNMKPAELEIAILPPFWRTWWFMAAAGALIAALIALAFWLRVRTLEKRRAAQAEFSRRLMMQQEEERKRVAVELHDSLGQNLLVIKNRALLAAEAQGGAPAVALQLDEISVTASNAIDEVRRIAYNLRPAELDHLGITKAIETLLRRVGDTSPALLLSTQLDPIDGLLRREEEVNVFRIVQEWMSNVVRHAGATAAVVSIRHQAPRLTIRIQDDGVGLPQTESKDGRIGMGIRSIAERAKMLGGTCEIVSDRGEGTTLSIEIHSRSAP